MNFVEYPKMLYKVEPPHEKTVENKEQEVAAIKDGWQLAEDFFSEPPKGIEGDGKKDESGSEKSGKKGKK